MSKMMKCAAKCGTCSGWGRVPSLTELITDERNEDDVQVAAQPVQQQQGTEQCPDCLGSGRDYGDGGRHVSGTNKRGAYDEY